VANVIGVSVIIVSMVVSVGAGRAVLAGIMAMIKR
jgi:hypothetical protein